MSDKHKAPDQPEAEVQAEETHACEQCTQYKSGWQRAQADYQNLQKEVETKRSEWVQMSEVQILEEFIPVYDNLKKAFAVEQGDLTKEQANWKKGIELTLKQFADILSSHNVHEMQTVGEIFNPAQHEAVSEETDESKDDGVILKEIDSGYILGDKVIKVAKVIVNKNNS